MHTQQPVTALCAFDTPLTLFLMFRPCHSYVDDLQRELSSLTSSRTKLAADKAQAEDRVVIAQRALPELEAAKKAAAQKKVGAGAVLTRSRWSDRWHCTISGIAHTRQGQGWVGCPAQTC